MKSVVRGLIVLLILFISIPANALRISHYEATFDLDPDIKDDQITMFFGYRGEESYTTSLEIEYDSTLLEYVEANPTEGFYVDVKEQTLSSNTKKLSLTYTANFVITQITYGSVIFKVKNNFLVGDTTEIKVSNVISTNDNGNKYRSEGYYLSVKRETTKTMSAVKSDFGAETDRKKFIDKILPFVIVGIIAIFLIMFMILLIPTGKHEDRSKKVTSQIDPKNYPQPGVGPLPKFNKKKKKDIIEPEEKTIQPLAQFVAKTVDMNSEKMNKPLETDPNVFKDNPSRQGKQGLININPLAFDDGESDDDDDIETL